MTRYDDEFYLRVRESEGDPKPFWVHPPVKSGFFEFGWIRFELKPGQSLSNFKSYLRKTFNADTIYVSGVRQFNTAKSDLTLPQTYVNMLCDGILLISAGKTKPASILGGYNE